MNVIFVGPPGAGKGTQAVRVCEKLASRRSPRAIFFAAPSRNKRRPVWLPKPTLTPVRLCRIPSSLTSSASGSRRRIAGRGYVLDGFPRTVPQAEALAGFADIDAVVDIDVSDEKLIDRLSGRRVCPSCGGTYHISRLNGRTDCERCGATLIQRDDDKGRNGAQPTERLPQADGSADRVLRAARASAPCGRRSADGGLLRGDPRGAGWNEMITIKNASQIAKMREAGALLHEVLEQLKGKIEPGITTKELDRYAERAHSRLRRRPFLPEL